MDNLEDVADYLPDIVKEIIEVIGFSATEKLVRELGGSQFRFSQGMNYYPKLVEVIGKELAQTLCKYFQREDIYIPRCNTALRMLRNQRLKADFDRLCEQEKLSGRMAMLQLCPKYQLSDRQVWDIVYSFRRESCQARLL